MAVDYDEYQAEIMRLKRERCPRFSPRIPPGRAVGRRPRDTAEERMLTKMERIRLAREALIPPAPKPE